MKKMSFVVAILVSAALAGCHHKKASTTTPTGSGSAMGSDMSGGSAAPAGSDATGGAAGGSAM
jgi:hypothetical protein